MGWTRGTMNRPKWKTTINIVPNPSEPNDEDDTEEEVEHKEEI